MEKKYKKCCLGKEGNSEAGRQPQGSADDGEGEEPYDWEMIADMYNNFRRFSLEDKPHIKGYKKIRKMHTEIVVKIRIV